MKLIFKYFFISLLFLNGQLVHAQSFKIDSLKGKKWELQLPKGKSYTSNLIFKDTTYTTSFSFNGQTHTIEKPYLIQQENVETFYVIFPSEGKGTCSQHSYQFIVYSKCMVQQIIQLQNMMLFIGMTNLII